MSQPESILPVIKISRESIQVLQQNGITAETIGLQRMANGSALVTLEIVQDVKSDLREAVMEAEDYEAKAALANALANLIKSEATLLRAIGTVPAAQSDGSKRQRKSFAPAAPIDVQPSK